MNRTDIINLLISTFNYRTYLEIGVDNPSINFYKIKCAHKVGVDPNVRGVRYVHTMTSDAFFIQNKIKFDLIFVDGLHHADQVYKDLLNSISTLKPGGCIVVHDCYPTTEEMQKVPRVQGEWTGDVWKAWCKLRDTHDLNMRVLDTDYGVGIIFKGGELTKIEHIGNLTYSKFAKNPTRYLNLTSSIVPEMAVLIPAFEQYGYGYKVFDSLLKSLYKQKWKNFEIIVHDNANNNRINKICKEWASRLPKMQWFRTDSRGGSNSLNTLLDFADEHTYAIHYKWMFQDDLLMDPYGLLYMSWALKFYPWVVSAGFSIDGNEQIKRTRTPVYSDRIIEGKNTVGMPSVTAHRRNEFRFDPNLKTMLDCDFYYWMHKKFGLPGAISKHLIGSRYWDKSTSRQQGSFINQEVPYLKNKYGLTANH